MKYDCVVTLKLAISLYLVSSPTVLTLCSSCSLSSLLSPSASRAESFSLSSSTLNFLLG